CPSCSGAGCSGASIPAPRCATRSACRGRRTGSSRRCPTRRLGRLRYSGIVRIALGSGRVEGLGAPLVERGIESEATHRVRVGAERLAEGPRLGFAGFDHGLGRGLVEALVSDPDAAERGLELRADAVFAQLLARADEGETALAELTRQIRER